MAKSSAKNDILKEEQCETFIDFSLKDMPSIGGKFNYAKLWYVTTTARRICIYIFNYKISVNF